MPGLILDCDRHAERVAGDAQTLAATARLYEILWLWNHRLISAADAARQLGNDHDEPRAAAFLERMQDSIIRRRARPRKGDSSDAETTL